MKEMPDGSLAETGDQESYPDASERAEEVDEQATDDQEFKKNYSKETLARTTTLRLKASFHLINYLMMAVCNVMLNHEAADESDLHLPSKDSPISELTRLAGGCSMKVLNPYQFMVQHKERCIYKVSPESSFDIRI